MAVDIPGRQAFIRDDFCEACYTELCPFEATEAEKSQNGKALQSVLTEMRKEKENERRKERLRNGRDGLLISSNESNNIENSFDGMFSKQKEKEKEKEKRKK